jgi:hypothetical membrane protein
VLKAESLRWFHGLTGTLAAAGIAAPLLFTMLVIVQSVLQPDYSHVALPISALAAWPHGWIQNVNFFAFGVLMIAYAIGLHVGLRPTRGGLVGPGLLVLSGVGLLLAGAFPWRHVNGDFTVPAGHYVGALLSFLGAGTGLIVTSRRMPADPIWRGLARYALASGITMVVLFVVIGAFAVPVDAPLHVWAGLLQRIVLAVWFPCTIILAVRLRNVARAAGQHVADAERGSHYSVSA